MHRRTELWILRYLVLEADGCVVGWQAPRLRATAYSPARAGDKGNDQQQRHDEDVARQQPDHDRAVLVEQRRDGVRVGAGVGGNATRNVCKRASGKRGGARRCTR